MTLESGMLELMNASIDGEISASDRATLDEHLARDADARTQYEDLADLCAELNTMDAIEPPAHLKHVILNTLPMPKAAQRPEHGGAMKALLDFLFGGGVTRYALPFAAGALLTFAFISSDPASRQAHDDVSALVGTITQPVPAAQASVDSIRVNLDEVVGSVQLKQSGSNLILDFDLAASEPIEIVTGISGQESVSIQMQGQRHYALTLNGSDVDSISLRFFSAGGLIHEDQLIYGE